MSKRLTNTTLAALASVLTIAVSLMHPPAAKAAIEVIEKSYEMPATRVERWPTGDEGSIVIRPCRDCDRVVLRVTGETAYGMDFGNTRLTRDEFMRAKGALRSLSDRLVFVFYRPDDGIVTRLILKLTPGAGND